MPINSKLYVLELTDDKYYVGQTTDLEFRFQEHLGRSNGAGWTRMHKPLRILLTRDLVAKPGKEAMLYENWLTLEMMEKFGWENVRGGDFTIVEPTLLEKQITHIYDCETNKIKYYVTENCKYLFGRCANPFMFVLELSGGRYYVGSSDQLGKELGMHFCGSGTAFTRDHPVIRVLELVEVLPGTIGCEALKDQTIRKYMSEFGWDNVRGQPMPSKCEFK